jgi:cytochrome oxidase Cu insertion factor (SCO1/SenC/PrrC family)
MPGSKSSVPARAHAEPVEFTVHSLPNAGQAGDQQQRVRSGRWKMLAVLAVCAAPVVASYFTYFVVRPQARTNYSTLIQPTRALPADLPLRMLDGQPVAAASLKGQWLLVAVGGGACDEQCDKRLFLQRQLREMMGKERERIDKVWLVTDDAPVPPAVREALSTPPTTVLRTSPEALSRWLQPEAGQPLDSALYLVDPMGEWMMRTPVNPDPAKLKRDLDKLLRASGSWDRPGR